MVWMSEVRSVQFRKFKEDPHLQILRVNLVPENKYIKSATKFNFKTVLKILVTL